MESNIKPKVLDYHIRLYSETIDPILKEMQKGPTYSNETIKSVLNSNLRSMDKDLADSRKIIEDSAKKLSTISQETIEKNFEEGRKALAISSEQTKEINLMVDKYTKGSGNRVADKIKKLESERELLEIGKNAIDIIAILKDESKYEEIKGDLIGNRKFKLISTLKHVADSLGEDEKYKSAKSGIFKLFNDSLENLRKEFIQYKDLAKYNRVNVLFFLFIL